MTLNELFDRISHLRAAVIGDRRVGPVGGDGHRLRPLFAGL